MRFVAPLRRGAACLLAVSALCLGACASVSAPSPVGLQGEESPVHFDTGAVAIYLVDYNGAPLRKAMVNIESADVDNSYRTAAFSDDFGQVSFRGVPESVRISVFHSETSANYSRVFDVPSRGITELRMILETYVEPPPVE
jgi:hypothetical protein